MTQGFSIKQRPPNNPSCGDSWFNTTNGKFYYFNEIGKWIAIDGDLVVDVIDPDDFDTDKAYERAMSIL